MYLWLKVVCSAGRWTDTAAPRSLLEPEKPSHLSWSVPVSPDFPNQIAVPSSAPPVVQVRLVPPALAHLRRRREPLRGAAQEQAHHGEEQEHGGHRAAGGRVSADFYTREKITTWVTLSVGP